MSVLAVILPAFAEETRWLVVFALKLSANLPPSLPYRYEGGTTVNESYNGHVATHRLASSLQLDWFSLLIGAIHKGSFCWFVCFLRSERAGNRTMSTLGY